MDRNFKYVFQKIFQLIELIHAAHVGWNDSLAHDEENSFSLAIQGHHLIKKDQFSILKNLKQKFIQYAVYGRL